MMKWCLTWCPQVSVDILGTSCDQCWSMVQYSFMSMETRRLVRTDSPGRPPRLSHSSWTMKEYPFTAAECQSGFQARSKDQEILEEPGLRWSWTLNFAQKRSWVGRWSWAEQVGRLLLRVVQVVRQQRCNGHCLSDSVQHSSWKSNCTVHKSLGNGEGTPP